MLREKGFWFLKRLEGQILCFGFWVFVVFCVVGCGDFASKVKALRGLWNR